ncbi:multifunctional oxoglutarate decarboxylase/oxoglutarate dehydrogenase thiamine pyrophosphate-binding subunit/dihydrolipoyllysine-residue succinyltransferase subunit [Cellulomonas shaoxiangyii]|uniref:Multifunctional oxoglutarate decarboxylase/oxoglutarate dehydrogenase thiamine pyrophosphate-binding subunit/dihydrolipoyllysine-residue succinyltransferase subunit n=1 Tax=Cellulomonas shaoxiangyii TaxID=2566013 RepID=A0A4V1CMU6_9CELL|nr:multifunctional oxoglutarate decarboxylase/oxoglutarate dehydrogenase thiamine pyrophosphate-binding subunit/dihydrolipoyllysine-residue succinyltransferase subunit [Cellulomonas shaoxiangyii]QCB94175.1 multifunctional oxoglutarate decarboxylase/oxoglutarate dehydrogenase thiamine pyrophosphate-binding subunit/dihydrolipoyllysine-residue succinyltransferase subunit [Cellulomonas shaoxiangyii]TGY86668.1 multifunctional oxoglutarate decarboxylase/oxoglutarate dehydrogenase thiamine pyrophosphate
MTQKAQSDPTRADFGANEWLVDELYEQYQKDRNAVDPAWWDFFEGYQPGTPSPAGEGRPTTAPATAPTGATASTATPATATPATVTVATATAATGTSAPVAPAPAPAATNGAPTTPRQASGPAPEPKAVAVEDPSPAAPPKAPTAAPSPVATAQPATAPYAAVAARRADEPVEAVDDVQKLRGPAARVVTNMESSLEVPTATSVRAVPAKLMVDNRIVINNHLSRGRGGKVSFTHLIGFALVEALGEMPAMNAAYTLMDGKPGILQPAHVNLGLAIDLAKPDGSRQLLVPSIKKAETLDFAQFWTAYEDVVRRARANKLAVDDFAGTTISLTNPGTIGTVHSVPRLMQGQGTIVGVGAMDYPAEFAGTSAEQLNRMGVSKVLTITSTYDHRIIQGAQSGDFLRILGRKLLGEDGFYDRVFASLRVPYEPVRWVRDADHDPDAEAIKPARIAELIHAYRSRGHLMADTDPLAYRQRKHPDLDVQNHGLTLWDLDRTFPTGGFTGKNRATLRDVLGLLRDSYCRTVGVEYMHLQDPRQRRWLQERLESGYARTPREDQLRILRRLNAAEAFETFLQTKYVGQKRFSLEGGESLIPLLDAVLSKAANGGLDEVGIGMAHRGRLNVLSNIAGKSYGQIFSEFEGNQDPKSVQGSGDVKYHLGTEGRFTAESGATTAVYLAANPSHLEAVDPVLEGVVRAKQDRIDLGGDGFSVLPILIHGDAAFAGQGVVFETLNLAQLRGYRTGGTIHVIVNNQVGFTTGPSSSRSSQYATDVVKGLQVPVFHVNGDDPEACVRVAELAFEYREQFARDVVIDMVCYRRRGHNEGDDPSMTQPLMYNLIEAKRSVRKLYTETLVARGDITLEEAEQVLRDYQAQLERVFTETREDGWTPPQTDVETVAGLERPESQQEDAGVMVGWKTAVPSSVLERIGQAHVRAPEGFTIHPKLAQMLAKREQMSRDGGIDWGFGEILAFGSLLIEGTPVRLAGQDSRRGTFVQRHAVLHDRETGAEWTPLLYLSGDQAKFWVYDSSLSEYAAVGFEYGYSVERPDALVLWEAQFGDFVNGAQTVIDEFLSSAEQKWGQRSSVVMLLPHGYEGQGPDHSSARIERFLQLAAEDNMTIAQPSNPASYFHLLRRQAYQRPRRPLVVFTPKSMLRLKAATSGVEDFTTGTFRTVVPDELAAAKADQVSRVLLCSGKIYWDLLAHRVSSGDQQTAILRFEQLYPLEPEAIREALAPFDGAELVWVQDEPRNQGPWTYMSSHLPQVVERPLRVVSRPESASPAAGSAKKHAAEQKELVETAFRR